MNTDLYRCLANVHFCFKLDLLSVSKLGRKPPPGLIGNSNENQHQRNLNQNTHHRCQCSPRLQTEQCNGCCDCQLEKVAGANHGPGRSDAVADVPQSGPAVGQEENQESLHNQRHGNQHDMQRVVQDNFALERKQQYQGNDQRCRGDRPQAFHEHLVVPALPALCDQGAASKVAGGQGNDNVQHHGEDNRVPGHLNVGNAQQEHHNGREGEEHDDVVQRHLHQSIGGIAFGEIAPDKHHGGAGCSAQQDGAGQVFAGQVRCNQRLEHHHQEEPGNGELSTTVSFDRFLSV